MKALWCLVVAGAVSVAGCAKDEPRELGRDEDRQGTLEGQQGQQGQVGQTGDQQASKQALDGKTFNVTLDMPDGKQVQDTLIFRDGKLDSTACREYGFSPAPYTVTKGQGDELTFHSIAQSGAKQNHWSGTVKGDQIDGRLLMQEPGQAGGEATFSGRIVSGGEGQGLEQGQGANEGQVPSPGEIGED